MVKMSIGAAAETTAATTPSPKDNGMPMTGNANEAPAEEAAKDTPAPAEATPDVVEPAAQ
ncbi:MAG: hypothetical protein ACT4OY_07855 [Alphaproteobacteria bacterium]